MDFRRFNKAFLTFAGRADTIIDSLRKTKPLKMKSEISVEVEGLSLSFKNKVLISDLSFSLRAGERISVSGKSGSGKTTLLRCLLGFAYPQEGTIFIEGRKLDDRSVWPLRRKIGYVPQEPDLGNQRLEEFLRMPFFFKANRELRWDVYRVHELFSAFQLEEELLGKKTTQLSGGEKQRAALIAALLLERRTYLLDEVTSALDDDTKKAVLVYLRERKDLSLLFVTHDKEIKEMSHNVFSLNKGSN